MVPVVYPTPPDCRGRADKPHTSPLPPVQPCCRSTSRPPKGSFALPRPCSKAKDPGDSSRPRRSPARRPTRRTRRLVLPTRICIFVFLKSGYLDPFAANLLAEGARFREPPRSKDILSAPYSARQPCSGRAACAACAACTACTRTSACAAGGVTCQTRRSDSSFGPLRSVRFSGRHGSSTTG